MKYTFSLTYPAADAARVQQASQECRDEHFEAVSRAWGAYVPADFDEKMREARVWAAGCMRECGMDVEESPSHEVFVELLQSTDPAFTECVVEAQQRFNLGPVIP